jgi:hypothetical protein
MHTIRAGEIQAWMASGEYERIVRGEYVRRGAEARERPLRDDFAQAGRYYADEARNVASQVADAAKRAASSAKEAFRQAQQKS